LLYAAPQRSQHFIERAAVRRSDLPRPARSVSVTANHPGAWFAAADSHVLPGAIRLALLLSFRAGLEIFRSFSSQAKLEPESCPVFANRDPGNSADSLELKCAERTAK
jgi:hypothetical protein